MDDDERRVFEFDKNARERVVARLTEFKGHRLGDIRLFGIADDGVREIPTKKGICVRVEMLPKLRDAVDALIAETRKGRRRWGKCSTSLPESFIDGASGFRTIPTRTLEPPFSVPGAERRMRGVGMPDFAAGAGTKDSLRSRDRAASHRPRAR